MGGCRGKSRIYEYPLRTRTEEFVNTTGRVRESLAKSDIGEESALFFVPIRQLA